MFCIFAFKVWGRKSYVKYWHTLSSVFVHFRVFLVLDVNIGTELQRYATFRVQDLNVLVTEGLYGKIHDFLAEDWLRPPPYL